MSWGGAGGGGGSEVKFYASAFGEEPYRTKMEA